MAFAAAFVLALEYGPIVLVEDIGQGLMDEIQTPEGIAAVAGETIGGIAGAKVKPKIEVKIKELKNNTKVGEEMVTYRRVQGGTPPNASRTRIKFKCKFR